jgi:hypothetical protein
MLVKALGVGLEEFVEFFKRPLVPEWLLGNEPNTCVHLCQEVLSTPPRRGSEWS